MFAAGMDGFVHVKSVHASCASGDDFTAAGQDYRRAVMSFDYPGSDDANHAFVPMWLVKDSRPAIRGNRFLFEDRQCFFGYTAIRLFPIRVVRMKLAGIRKGDRGVRFDK